MNNNKGLSDEDFQKLMEYIQNCDEQELGVILNAIMENQHE